ncbi:hypothetical protein B7494_g927 [Chlorociboria aeruginascens]|nr:hypothetical protein B7494_g927 [Chlorociboria aeruginascens]
MSTSAESSLANPGPNPLRPPVVEYSDSNQSFLYGISQLLICTSNHPQCLWENDDLSFTWPEKKHISPFPLDDFALVYETIVYPAILEILKTHEVINELDQLHAISMGFRASSLPVLLFIFRQIALPAAALVTNAVADLLAKEWPGPQPTQDESIDWFDKYPHILEDPLLPGSSIGLAGSTSTGTLCVFLSHGGDIYALTNQHVIMDESTTVNEDRGIGRQPYKYKTGMQKLLVHCPSDVDWNETRTSQEDKIEIYHNEIVRKTLAPLPQEEEAQDKAIAETEKWIQQYKSLVEMHQARLRQMERYDREIGHIVLTSGFDSPSQLLPRQDWALIKCTKLMEKKNQPCYKNQHRRYPSHNSGPFMPQILSTKNLNAFEAEWDVDISWYRKTRLQFDVSPPLDAATTRPAITNERALLPWSPVTDPHYIKPPSARSGFEYAVRNGIKSTVVEQFWGLTREHIFVHPILTKAVTTKGDSGTAILNKQYEIEFMAWGGSKEVIDITYAIFFANVLADIERKAGWQPGSLMVLKSGKKC